MKVNNCHVAGDALILVTTHAEAGAFAQRFKAGEYDLKEIRRKRSLDANAYCWVLCAKIADAVGATKEEVYRRNIREGGEYTPLPIKAEAVEEFKRIWSAHGIGWFAEEVYDSKLPGYKLLFAYHGSSVYDTRQMALLIDRIVQDAKAVGVETMTPLELESLKESW